MHKQRDKNSFKQMDIGGTYVSIYWTRIKASKCYKILKIGNIKKITGLLDFNEMTTMVMVNSIPLSNSNGIWTHNHLVCKRTLKLMCHTGIPLSFTKKLSSTETLLCFLNEPFPNDLLINSCHSIGHFEAIVKMFKGILNRHVHKNSSFTRAKSLFMTFVLNKTDLNRSLYCYKYL